MLAKEKQKVVEVLKELSEFVHDGLEGYERAAEESKDQLRKNIYRKFSQQRLAFANELNMIIQKNGGTPERDTTTKGKLYRQWMDFKAALTGNSEEAILGSNIYGEEWAQKAFRDALDHDLPAEVRGTILRQREASTDALDRLHQLREGISGDNAPTGTATRGAGSAPSANIPLKTALYAAAGAAGAALIFGLVTKRIPTDRLQAAFTKAKDSLLSAVPSKEGKKKSKGNK